MMAESDYQYDCTEADPHFHRYTLFALFFTNYFFFKEKKEWISSVIVKNEKENSKNCKTNKL